MPTRFLPGPLPMRHGACGPFVPQKVEETDHYASLFQSYILAKSTMNFSSFSTFPYDFYLPSITEEKLNARSCPYCKFHAPTEAAKKRHLTIHSGRPITYEDEEETSDEEPDNAYLIKDLTEWLLGSLVYE